MVAHAQLRELPSQKMVQGGPVTIVVRHRIRPNKLAEFEDWLRGILQEMGKFAGYHGYNVLHPVDRAQPEYVVFFRFDTFARLEAWENSAERKIWLAKVAPLSVNAAVRERHTGMEVWFALPAGHRPPQRWKMALVTLLAIYPFVLLSQVYLTPQMLFLPIVLRTFVTSAVLVCVMTYFQMPLVTKLFSRWLYGPAV